jgi:hypothetical protein
MDTGDGNDQVRVSADGGDPTPSPAEWTREEEPAGEPKPRFADSFGLVLLFLVISYYVNAAVGDQWTGRALTLLLLATTTWLALRASQVNRKLPRLVPILIIVAVLIGAGIGIGASDEISRVIAFTLNAILVIVAPMAIIRRLVHHHIVNAETFYASICVYLMLAMFFASVYPLVAWGAGQPFFGQEANPTQTDYLYFSLVTITTTGYGDLTAQIQVGRILAMTEAVIGQLYLITVVAMVVQNFGRERQRQLPRQRRRS